MSSILHRKERLEIDAKSFISIVIWEVDPAILGSRHGYKYSLAYVVNGECVMHYDNERGKGDHKHIRHKEISTTFTTIEALVDDFFNDIETLRR
ncbi:DUF6516 family protein [Serratia symbiotica]|uniref:toxin-antitoxin system TumE family protein n=1 Tax=Serratia symbiotica TaxID=138074 RepID=UPI0020909594|nr:DUF6516 family protein [Serratia symbiotica]USS95527.1 DUF6516 family protein [Serratia symbiotica]